MGVFGEYGESPREILTTLATRPDVVANQVLIPEKKTYIKDLFSPLGYLPLLSPYTYFGLPIMGQNLISSDIRLASVYNYYHSSMLPFIFLGLIHTLSWVFNRTKHRKKLIILTLTILLIHLIFWYDRTELPARRLPFNSYYNQPFMSKSNDDNEQSKVLTHIPAVFTIAMGEKYMEHLAERRFYYDAHHFENIKPDLVIVDKFEFPAIAGSLYASSQYVKMFDHYNLLLYANKQNIKHIQLSDYKPVIDNKQYIVLLPAKIKAFSTLNYQQTESEEKHQILSTSLYHNHDFAQPFISTGEKLASFTLTGIRVNKPVGNFVAQIQTDVGGFPSGEVIYEKSTPIRELSQEYDTILFQPRVSMEREKQYWIVVKIDTKNSDSDRFDISIVESANTPLTLPVIKMSSESGNWQKDWTNNRRRLLADFYFETTPQINTKTTNAVQSLDGTILYSGTGKDINTFVNKIIESETEYYKEVLILSSEN